MYNEFQAYTPDKKNTYVRDGILFIKPVSVSRFDYFIFTCRHNDTMH